MSISEEPELQARFGGRAACALLATDKDDPTDDPASQVGRQRCETPAAQQEADGDH